MPSRLITTAILAFWLIMTGWLIQREVVPMMLAEASPTYQPDLTDEIGSPEIAWRVLRDGKRIGSARSRILSHDDRTREFHVAYQFSQFTIGLIDVEKIDLTYRVSEEGKLLALATKFEANSPVAALLLGQPRFTAELKGDIVDEELEPFLIFNGKEKMPDVGKIRFVQKGHFINPMHVLNRVRDLREGQTWTITLPDFKSSANNQVVGDLIKQVGGPSVLIARVTAGTLSWDQAEVDCHKIEYHEPGKEVTVQTWVRKLDGLVLQQDTSQFGFEMVLRRVR